MLQVPDYEFWFVTGSQHLYGEEQLKSVEKDARDMVDKLNASKKLPYPIVFKMVATTADSITQLMKDVNYNDKVAGVITWMHTFSPAKNWIRGTKLLQKPLLHLATQYLDHIPYDTIDFDYMNLNQSAHGDREYGFINARLQKHNKIVYGWWGDPEVQDEIADWEDVAVAYDESFKIKVARFGDNMRNVAVTEGDKVEAQIQFGWTVDYFALGDLVESVNAVSESDIDKKYKELQDKYEFVQGDNDKDKYEHSVRYQIREYFGIKNFLDKGNYSAFTTNFEDLYGLEQLPGLAAQLLMDEGYGFGAEGDWKTAALDRLVKILTHNQATAFMEDYTLELQKGKEAILGSHMLEVDPGIASDKPRVEVHPLDIGGKADPARLVFTGREGDAMDITISDFGTEYRMIGYAVEGHKAPKPTPHLPVAKQMWTPKMGLKHGATQWIHDGGGHHTVLTFAANETQIQDLATMFGLTFNDIK
ncbi:L-arabinose isomerase [Lentilactobacillus kefiri]|jgi:L-arabinose isomerase|uniref:L-arabinose isomerase n=2 Tax=Lentilactobacillus kefiri TaxID=33962 RepID=A0A8E1RLV6_LENKE|nr:L-arabinose isomerase [Lentilactobacillus kefiri]KRL70137.1 L-arabinose isomerase [Lentilactobacillus parakefiri DSM 10551]KRM54098.1 L-arabinose isomerase [Lentilactobacillus kefiri DSM 20587 = JCM 5818]MCJ2160946.1 L-arabinose isomerase [Lentilactobacillus kefiri]MCP9368873.1 L-arabinose isomerase [Lentilactobacillus kefiri]MDM7492965.1 L-arabinose isomerase [Lentilactobacillus kefiri]